MPGPKQTAAILIFPPGITEEAAISYLKSVLPTLTQPLQLGCVDSFNPQYGTPVVYQP